MRRTFCFAKEIPIVFWFCLLATTLIGQPAWIRSIDLANGDEPSGLLQADSNHLYLIHRSSDGNGNPVYQHVTKYSNIGEVLWRLDFSNAPRHVFRGPGQVLANGNLIVCFLYSQEAGYAYQVYCISPEGHILWQRYFPAYVQLQIDYSIRFYKVLESGPDDIRLYIDLASANTDDPLTRRDGYIRIDSLGREVDRIYLDPDGDYQWAFNIIPVGDSHYLRVVSPRPPSFWVELRFELLDTLYNRIWSYEIGPEDSAGGGPVCADAAGNIYFTWRQDPTGEGAWYNILPAIVSLSPTGDFRWIRYFAERDNDPIFYSIMTTADGRIIASGQEGNEDLNGGRHRTGLVVCIDTAGTKLWERRYVLEESSVSGNNFRYMTGAGDGGIVLTGESLIPGDSDAYIMKVDSEGCLLPGCELYNFISIYTHTEDIDQPEHFFKHSVMAGRLLIRPDGPMPPGRWRYEIYAMSGQPMSTGWLDDAVTEIEIADYMPGMYVLRIWETSGGGSGVVRFVKPY